MLAVLLSGGKAEAQPLVTGLWAAERQVTEVMAGEPIPFVLALSAGESIEPRLEAELLAVAGSTTARLRGGLSPKLERLSSAEAGVARFGFHVEVPAVTRPQEMLLRLRLRLPEGGTLTIPSSKLLAVPRTWRESFARFARVLPSGRIGTDERLAAVFTALPSDSPAHDDPADATSDPGVRCWFVVADKSDFTVPLAPAGAVWVVFKPGIKGCEVRRAPDGGPLYLVADVRAVTGPDHDACSQQLLEHTLAQARTLAGESSPLP